MFIYVYLHDVPRCPIIKVIHQTLMCKLTNLPDGRVVNITVLVLLPTVSAIHFVCSMEMGIGDSFSLILETFDTNTFVVRCSS